MRNKLADKLFDRWQKRVAEQADIYVQWKHGRMTESDHRAAVTRSEKARQDLVKRGR